MVSFNPKSKASVGSAIEAVRALESESAGAMALAAAPTDVGGAVLSGTAVTELAEAAAMIVKPKKRLRMVLGI